MRAMRACACCAIAKPSTKTNITQRCGYVNQPIGKDAALRKMGAYGEWVSLGCEAPPPPFLASGGS